MSDCDCGDDHFPCKRCGDDTSAAPDDLPGEWKGYCPDCVLIQVMNKELPTGSREQFMSLVTGIMASSIMGAITVTVNDEEPVIVEDERDMCFTGSGQILYYHNEAECMSKRGAMACPLHSPSDHHMRTWPIHARNDLKYPMLERICPHNAIHPDPDHMALVLKVDPDFNSFHGACDGCCKRA